MKVSSSINESFCQTLSGQANTFPDKVAITFIDNKLNVLEEITYRELVNKALSIAVHLQSEYKKGDVCMIIIKPGIEFALALIGCMFAGIIALPVHPPHRSRYNTRLWAILKEVDPSVILMSSELNQILQKSKDNLESLLEYPIVLIDKCDLPNPAMFTPPDIERDDPAILQFTSGTTGKPYGAIITQGGIMHNSELIKQSFGHDSDMVDATWLPPFHDMGLIGTLLQPLYVGGSNVILDTHDFLIHPVSWLKAITKYKATTAGCPNFALDLLTEKISDELKEHLDLSSLRVFFCGSEPVKRLSVKKFVKHFKECGFRESMFLPCYGLAENTLMATGISYNESPGYIRIRSDKLSKEKTVELTDDISGTSYVSCGYSWLDDEVIIVNPDNCIKQGEDKLGEIWIKGKSVSPGYWNEDAEKKKNFGQLNNDSSSKYLRTGDLGFFHGGHLFITDRIKDTIIINGKNHFPSEIESTVENCHSSLQPNGCVVLGTDGQSTENLLVIQELKRSAIRNNNPKEIFETIRRSLGLRHNVSAAAIILVYPGQLCRTSSGKKQRSTCRQKWHDGLLKVVCSWKKEVNCTDKLQNTLSDYSGPSKQQIQEWMISWLSKKINIDKDQIIPDKPILSYGLDSLGAVELEREAKEKFNITIHPLDFMENNSIAALARIGYENTMQSLS